jgi:integrase
MEVLMTAKKPTPTRERGSIVVRKDGRLELRAYAGKNPTGGDPYIRHYFPAGTDAESKEVRNKLTALVARADDLAATRKRRRKEGGQAPPVITTPVGERTVGAILEKWWQDRARHMPSAGDVRIHLDSYLLPKLETVEAWRLRPSIDAEERAIDPDLYDLGAFFDELLEKGGVGTLGREAGQPLLPSSVAKTKSYLKQAIDLEMRRPGTKLTGENPARLVKLPGQEDRESTTPEPDELAEFLPFLAGTTRMCPEYTATRRRKDGTPFTYTVPARFDKDAADRSGRKLLAYALLVASGLRPQEVSAVQRGNLDQVTGRLSLEAVGVVNGKIVRGETRKRRRRTIKLDARTLAAVLDLLRYQDETALKFGKKLTRRSYIFSDTIDCSTVVDPDVPSKTFERVVEAAVKAGIPIPAGMRLYDMRHYGITQLCRQGKSLDNIAKRFATSVRMIELRYNHPDPDADDGLADALEGAWGDLREAEAEVISIVDRSAQNEG